MAGGGDPIDRAARKERTNPRPGRSLDGVLVITPHDSDCSARPIPSVESQQVSSRSAAASRPTAPTSASKSFEGEERRFPRRKKLCTRGTSELYDHATVKQESPTREEGLLGSPYISSNSSKKTSKGRSSPTPGPSKKQGMKSVLQSGGTALRDPSRVGCRRVPTECSKDQPNLTTGALMKHDRLLEEEAVSKCSDEEGDTDFASVDVKHHPRGRVPVIEIPRVQLEGFEPGPPLPKERQDRWSTAADPAGRGSAYPSSELGHDIAISGRRSSPPLSPMGRTRIDVPLGLSSRRSAQVLTSTQGPACSTECRRILIGAERKQPGCPCCDFSHFRVWLGAQPYRTKQRYAHCVDVPPRDGLLRNIIWPDSERLEDLDVLRISIIVKSPADRHAYAPYAFSRRGELYTEYAHLHDPTNRVKDNWTRPTQRAIRQGHNAIQWTSPSETGLSPIEASWLDRHERLCRCCGTAYVEEIIDGRIRRVELVDRKRVRQDER
ncbi:hypothetical protein KVT40_008619 [Elsinoe batatas]|uniref:Uncharacterized protein n=1 Tax=Elsinoe batatas TaxID=2601811 RepID=A0A8K0KW16_9PEZI|nr:hypothetical protein KVT40_008619 [Elsinoe batatas]